MWQAAACALVSLTEPFILYFSSFYNQKLGSIFCCILEARKLLQLSCQVERRLGFLRTATMASVHLQQLQLL